MQHHPYSHTETFWGEADTTTLPSCFIAMVQMSSQQLQQEMASSKNTFPVLEPQVADYTGLNPSTVVAMVFYDQHYHSAPQEHALCLCFVPLLSSQATACVPLDLIPHRHSVPHLFPRTTDGVTAQSYRKYQNSFFKKKVDQFVEEKEDPVRFAQQELEQG